MRVPCRVTEPLGDEPADEELPRHALGGSDALADHELLNRHVRQPRCRDDGRAGRRKDAAHHDDPNAPAIE